MSIFVTLSDNRLQLGPITADIQSGRAGFIACSSGAEGDRKTPLGDYSLRFGLYRADRLPSPPPVNCMNPLTFRPLRPDDGWCDDPHNAAYNRFIKRPFAASHEALWREDGAYDIILVMSHNDSPPVAGLGSAVFIHIAQPDLRPTLGCITLTPNDMCAILPLLQRGMAIHITA